MLIKGIRCCEWTIWRTAAKTCSEKYAQKGEDYLSAAFIFYWPRNCRKKQTSEEEPTGLGSLSSLFLHVSEALKLLFQVTAWQGPRHHPLPVLGQFLEPSSGYTPQVLRSSHSGHGTWLLVTWETRCVQLLTKVVLGLAQKKESPRSPFSGSHTAWLCQLQEWASVSLARLPGLHRDCASIYVVH